MIKNIEDLAKFVKGGAEVLQKAINEKDEFNLEFVDGRLVTDKEIEDLKETLKKDIRNDETKIQYDFAIKDLKKVFGIEFEGKDRNKFAEAVKEKYSTTKPDEKYNELQISFTNLQKRYESDLNLKDSEIETYKKNLKNVSIVSELQKNAPEIKGLNVNQFMTLARSEFEFDFDENNGLIAKKAGQPIKDKMERTIPVKDILTDFAAQNGWFTTEGRGGGNQSGNKSEFKTINDVWRHMEQNKIDPISPEGVKLIESFKP
jgi:hypothetical protein